ncbi:hypothetical protein As57867_009278, partial [Aphanomyces stellatus]
MFSRRSRFFDSEQHAVGWLAADSSVAKHPPTTRTMNDEYLLMTFPKEMQAAAAAGFDVNQPLAETLKRRARATPDRVLYTFLDDKGHVTTTLTTAQVNCAARTIAATLQATPDVEQGDRAVLCYPPGLTFTTAFWGCLYANIVATPIYPPHPAMLAKDLPRFHRMVTDSGAKTILTTHAYYTSVVAKSIEKWPSNIVWLATDALDDACAEMYENVVSSMDDIAFFQYSSGSTSDPKAVMISHGNIQAQLLTWVLLVNPADTMVSWLPPYHDMGLVVFTLTPCAVGAHCISMDPLSFIKDPTLWLRTVTAFKGTLICAPNFAYALAARKTTPEMVATLKLSTLTLCLIAAEPIRAETLNDFKRTFAPAGFDAKTFGCGYGMAETTLTISGNITTSTLFEPTVLTVQKRSVENNRVELAPRESLIDDTTTIVGCGTLAPTFKVIVVEPNTGMELGEHQIGELWIQSPSVAKGYWNRDELTKEIFGATVQSRDGVWLRSGDMGFFSGSELFITGRLKDLIIVRGRNIYPQDIELSVELAHKQVRPGCVAAFSVEKSNEDGESVVVVLELQVDLKEDLATLKTIASDVASVVYSYHRLPCDAIVLLKPRSIPKTTSGKIQRKATKLKYEAGTLATQYMYRDTNKTEDNTSSPNVGATLDPAIFETQEELQLAQVWVDVLNLNANDVCRESSIFCLGGDSLSIMQVVAECEKRGISLSASHLYEEPVLWRAAQSIGEPTRPLDWPLITIAGSISEEILQNWLSKNNRPKSSDCIVYPVTPLQAGMVYATTKSRNAYIMQLPLVMDATFDTDVLATAFRSLVDKHDILRTTFVTSPMGIFQIIRRDTVELPMTKTEASSIDTFLEMDQQRGFEIGDTHFVRLTVVQCHDARYAVFTIHHALFDGWTLSSMMNDLAEALQGHPLATRPSFCRVVDYVKAQDLNVSEGFWRSYLIGYVPCPIGSTGHPDETLSDGSKDVTIHTHASITDIKAAAQRVGVSPAEFSKMAWAFTLRKYTRQNDVVFGQVVANRDIPVKDAESIFGPLINTVPYRVKFDDASPLQNFFDNVGADRGAMLAHSYAGLVDIMRWCGVEGELFDTLFVYQQLPDVPEMRLVRGLQSYYQKESPFSNEYTFELVLFPTEMGLRAQGLFKPNVLTRSQAKWMLVEFDHTLTRLCDMAGRECDLTTLMDLSPAQTRFIEAASFGPQSPLPYELLQHAFEERAKCHPEAPAIEFEGVGISYGELNDLANTLAARLTRLGVGVGCRVAVIMDRCLEFPLGLLAVLKVGATAIPLDAKFPETRLSQVLQSSGAKMVLTTATHKCALANMCSDLFVELVCIASLQLDVGLKHEPALSLATRNSEAILLFTSGSTGQPKGVVILHKGAVNVIASRTKEIGMETGTRVLQFLAIGFDMCQWEIWGALSNGCTLVLRGEDAFQTIATVDVLICTPTGLGLLGEPSKYPNLKFVTVGGEHLPMSLKDLWAPVVHLTNCCGPSECSIMSHSAQQHVEKSVHVGRPIPNVNCYVLDSKLRYVPIGVVGELYIGGIGVSPGYVTSNTESQKVFLPDPYSPNGGNMYQSGDYGIITPSQDYKLLGRKDNQVKLKGYRIELDEVAGAMMQHPQVVTAAAIVKDKTHLIGYFTPATVSSEELQDMVSSLLPVYMVPAV